VTDQLRELERDSIRDWVLRAGNAGCFAGQDVLDYGCGQQPYRSIVEAGGGRYHGFDRAGMPGNVSGVDVGDDDDPLSAGGNRWGAILCTQVLQYVRDPDELLFRFWDALEPAGFLVLTGATNWPEVEAADLHRHTVAGIGRMALECGFTVVQLESRAQIDWHGASLSLGYGLIANVGA
jgi:hypothetical protein